MHTMSTRSLSWEMHGMTQIFASLATGTACKAQQAESQHLSMRCSTHALLYLMFQQLEFLQQISHFYKVATAIKVSKLFHPQYYPGRIAWATR